MSPTNIHILCSAISGNFRVGAMVVLAGAALLFFAALGKRCHPSPPRLLTWIEKLLYAMILLGTVGLAITGLGSVIGKGEHVEGWALMLHCTVAPLFAIGLAGFALSAADRFMCPSLGGSCCSKECAPEQGNASGKCCSEGTHPGCPMSVVFFWLALIAGAVVMFAAALPMLPLLGTHGQELLIKIHRYSGLAFVALLLPHAARIFRGS
ncbi:MAG: hypothetical protein ABSH20_05750 [Tepidisphaeraceae bacterium]|jgi:hypothetical protein